MIRANEGKLRGFDDTNTYSVLAAEGFLPGYGLDNGWVIGTYEAPKYNPSFRDWELRRHPSLALREYVPGKPDLCEWAPLHPTVLPAGAD